VAVVLKNLEEKFFCCGTRFSWHLRLCWPAGKGRSHAYTPDQLAASCLQLILTVFHRFTYVSLRSWKLYKQESFYNNALPSSLQLTYFCSVPLN
jgi:hypothetical protein